MSQAAAVQKNTIQLATAARENAERRAGRISGGGNEVPAGNTAGGLQSGMKRAETMQGSSTENGGSGSRRVVP